MVWFIITAEEDYWNRQIWSTGSNIQYADLWRSIYCYYIWPICNAYVDSFGVHNQVDKLKRLVNKSYNWPNNSVGLNWNNLFQMCLEFEGSGTFGWPSSNGWLGGVCGHRKISYPLYIVPKVDGVLLGPTTRGPQSIASRSVDHEA